MSVAPVVPNLLCIKWTRCCLPTHTLSNTRACRATSTVAWSRHERRSNSRKGVSAPAPRCCGFFSKAEKISLKLGLTCGG